MADELLVKCKGCYNPFPVEEQMDRESFEGAEIRQQTHRCPHCGIGRPYDKGDYYFSSDERGSTLGDLFGLS